MKQGRYIHVGLREILGLVHSQLQELFDDVPPRDFVNVEVTGDDVVGHSLTFSWLAEAEDVPKMISSAPPSEVVAAVNTGLGVDDAIVETDYGQAAISKERLGELQIDFCVELLQDAVWRNGDDLYIRTVDGRGHVGPYNELTTIYGYLKECLSKKWPASEPSDFIRYRALVKHALRTVIHSSNKFSKFYESDLDIVLDAFEDELDMEGGVE